MRGRGAVLATSFFVAVSCGPGEYEYADLYRDLPFEMPRVERPVISGTRVCLTDFGAVPDGRTLNTKAFADAIEALSGMGGGHLDVPDGIWYTGPVTLKSGIDLHLSKMALVIFTDDPSQYDVIPVNFEGLDTRRCRPQIAAFDCHDISITGEGIIDGNGDAWRELNRYKVNPLKWKMALDSGWGVLSEDGVRLFPDEGYRQAKSSPRIANCLMEPYDEQHFKRFLRPVLVGFERCGNVLLEGCTYQNSPSWNLHPVFCRNLIVKDVTVKAPDYSANGDGIDVDACENTIIDGCSFDVGDDGVCVKSGRDECGRARGVPTRNLIVHDCTVYHGHGGFVVGSEMSGGVSNVYVSGCRYIGTEIGLRFKSRRGRGGVVGNIWVKDIVMKDIMKDAIVFDLNYGDKSAFTQFCDGDTIALELPFVPADVTTPEFRDIHIDNVRCSGAWSAMSFTGLPEKPVSGIHVSNSDIIADRGAFFLYCRDITLERVSITNRVGEKYTVLHCENFKN